MLTEVEHLALVKPQEHLGCGLLGALPAVMHHLSLRHPVETPACPLHAVAEVQKTGGVESVAEILNLIDRTTEKSILENLEEDDPDLVEQIRKLMFIFEDIVKLKAFFE